METCDTCGGELQWVNCPACEGEGGHVGPNGEWVLCDVCEGDEGRYECLSGEHDTQAEIEQ